MFVPLTALSGNHNRVPAGQIGTGVFRRVLLVGDPGSGKSTLVKKRYREICQQAITSRHGDIPVLIELKNLGVSDHAGNSASHNNDLVQLIKDQIVSVRTYAGDSLFESFMDDGRMVVFLDGLDEVRTEDFEMVFTNIGKLSDHLSRRHTNNRLIVTTRRQLYVNLAEELTETFATHLTLEPFTADDMYEFLTKWPYDSDTEAEVARIFGNLASQPNIRNMCESPLILAMYVAMDQTTGPENLPETRPDFYKTVTDELLVRRRGRQFGITSGLGLLRRSRQRILGRLALEHLLDNSQSRNTLQWETAVEIVRQEEDLSTDMAAIRLRELSRDTGLFTEERREESLRFIHLTFCEFFAAQAIVTSAEWAWSEITRRITDSARADDVARSLERFAEVVVFAAALEANEGARREKVRWATFSGYPEIALKSILDSQSYDDEVITAELDQIARLITETPPDERDGTWYHLFRLAATALRDRELALTAAERQVSDSLPKFFWDTVNKSREEFRALFLSFVRLDLTTALQMAQAMGIDPVSEFPGLLVDALDEPAALAYALAQFGKDNHNTELWGQILAVGAMTHRSLARRLAHTAAPEKFEKQIAEVRRRRGWHQCWAMRGSMLGIVLEAGCLWPGSWRVLRILSQLPVRKTRLSDRLLDVNTYAWFNVFAAAILIIFASTGITHFLRLNLPDWLVWTMFGFAALLIIISILSSLGPGSCAYVLDRQKTPALSTAKFSSIQTGLDEDFRFDVIGRIMRYPFTIRVPAGESSDSADSAEFWALWYKKLCDMNETEIEVDGSLNLIIRRFGSPVSTRITPALFATSPNVKLYIFLILSKALAAQDADISDHQGGSSTTGSLAAP